MSAAGRFATMPKDELRALCSKAGKRAFQLGRGHRWTPNEARAHGRHGGWATAFLHPAKPRVLKQIHHCRVCHEHGHNARKHRAEQAVAA